MGGQVWVKSFQTSQTFPSLIGKAATKHTQLIGVYCSVMLQCSFVGVYHLLSLACLYILEPESGPMIKVCLMFLLTLSCRRGCATIVSKIPSWEDFFELVQGCEPLSAQTTSETSGNPSDVQHQTFCNAYLSFFLQLLSVLGSAPITKKSGWGD